MVIRLLYLGSKMKIVVEIVFVIYKSVIVIIRCFGVISFEYCKCKKMVRNLFRVMVVIEKNDDDVNKMSRN